jgi:hypothetical protein
MSERTRQREAKAERARNQRAAHARGEAYVATWIDDGEGLVLMLLDLRYLFPMTEITSQDISDAVRLYLADRVARHSERDDDVIE